MKYMIYLLLVLFFAVHAEISWAESPVKTVELDITMEMLDEDAEAASDIVHVIALPIQLMQEEQVRNQALIRQANKAGKTEQGQDAQHTVQGEITTQVNDVQRAVMNEINSSTNDAQRIANEDMGSQKGR